MGVTSQLGGGRPEAALLQRMAVVLILANDEGRLEDVLQSVAWADVRLAVDLGCTDASVRVCKAQEVPVVGAGDVAGELTRQRADWVLLLEGHEQVSPALAEELQRMMSSTVGGHGAPAAYAIGCDVRFLGRALIAHSDTRPAAIRLVRADACPAPLAAIDRLHLPGAVGRLEGRLLAQPYASLQHYVSRVDVLTTGLARQVYDAGRRVRWLDLVVRPFLHGLRFFPRAVIRDGLIGAVFTVLESYRLLVTAAKRWELEQRDASRRQAA